jgi:hypothetical protein
MAKENAIAEGTVWVLAIFITVFNVLLMAGQIGWIDSIRLGSTAAATILIIPALTILYEMWQHKRLNIKSMRSEPRNVIEIFFVTVNILIGLWIFFTNTFLLPTSMKWLVIVFDIIGLVILYAEMRFWK